MERKIYANQSTSFNHVDDGRRIYAKDNKSQTLLMRNQLSAFALDCILIAGILIITFFII